jgi:hypothetical protein
VPGLPNLVRSAQLGARVSALIDGAGVGNVAKSARSRAAVRARILESGGTGMNWLRYGYPRKHVVRLTRHCLPGRIRTWLLKWLYPDICVVKFR